MLSNLSVTEALGICGSNDRITLNPFPNSFLDTLVGLTKTGMAEYEVQCADSQGSIEQNAYSGLGAGDALLAFTDGCWSANGMHTALIDDQVTAIIDVATRNINLARTDALPILKDAMAQFNQLVNPDIPYAYAQTEIIPVQFGPLWSSEYVMNVANDFKDSYNTKDAPRGLIVNLQDEAYQDFVALTKTGLNGVDSLLGKLIQSYTTEELSKVFAEAFYDGVLPVGSLESGLRIDNLLLVHVWAQKLIDLPPKESSVNLGSYKEGMAMIIARTGFRIFEATQRRKFLNEGDVVVIAYQGDKRIVVNADNYTDWLKKGGKPEIIMGASVCGDKARPQKGSDLLENANHYLTEWKSYVSVTSARDQENKLASARGEFHRIIARAIEARHESGFIDSVDAAYDRLNIALDLLPLDFLKDPYCWIRDALITVLYPESDILNFIRAMDNLCEEDDDLTEDDAATLATVDYLTSWIAKFIQRGTGPV